MRKHLIKRTVSTAATLILALMMTASLSAGTFTYADTEDEASGETTEAVTTEEADADAAAPLVAKARKAAADGLAAKQAADQEAAKKNVKNPLTGLGDYNADAVGKRPLAVVVENDPKARPQWGIDDPEKSPDIIVEGEMEGGETRTLWFWADMTALPSQVGPTRSARPPYIRFSELFDAIFVHCGLSHSSSDYVGADAVFEQDGVDHINMLTYGERGMFGRDYSRTSMLEHTAYVDGSKVMDTINEFGFRLDLKEGGATTFSFIGEEPEEEPAIGEGLAAQYRYSCGLVAFPPAPEEPAGTVCNSLDLSFSSITPTKHWEYSESDKMYHTQDYYTDVARTNILILYDTTQYVVRANTWGSNPETYTDYLYEGGSGKLAHDGRIEEITWKVEGGKLVLTDANGETAKLAPGKTWIAFSSSNHGGWDKASE